MNKLQLANRLMLECGVSGDDMATTVDQSKELNRLVSWVNTSWVDIQSQHQDWDWMRQSCSFVTVDHQATYTPAQCGVTDFGMWDVRTFRNYETSVGAASEIFLDYMEYDAWRDSYQYGSLRTSYDRPLVLTVTPAKAIGLGPVPLAGYTVVGDYFAVPTELVLDDDEPSLPEQFHMAIVYRAMMHYGMFEAAPEVMQRGQAEFRKIMSRLERDRLPTMTLGGALV